MTLRVFAIAAHPDDIEFGMAGTLALLRRYNCDIHYMNIADGCCGSDRLGPAETAAVRLREAQATAACLGAVFHPPLVPDLEIFYEKPLLARVGSVVREVSPDILLVPSPEDYMEDHTTACRIAVTAAFCRTMSNWPVEPPRPPVFNEVALYHAQPYGNRDALGRLVHPDLFVNIEDVLPLKRGLLALHASQKEWLDRSQGFDSYLETMDSHAREAGALSGRFRFAEGWRRHNPLGLCALGLDPLKTLLGPLVVSAPEPTR